MLRLGLIAAVLGASAGVHAAPACFTPGHPVFDAATKQLVACDYDGKHCTAADVATKVVKPVAAAVAEANPAAHPSAAHDAICEGDGDATCVKLGKSARAALAKTIAATADSGTQPPPPPDVQISADHAYAIIGGTLWNVKADRAVRVKTWSTDPGYKDPPTASAMVGELVVYSITPCAGPCTESRLYTRGGKLLTKVSFEGVESLTKLTDDVSVGLGQQGGLVKVSAKDKRVHVWNEINTGAVTDGELFVIDGAPYTAMVDQTANALMIYQFARDAETKVSVSKIPACAP
jgi:hypothetical protein